MAGKPFPHFSEDAAAYQAQAERTHVPVASCPRNAALEAKMVADFTRDTAALLGLVDLNGLRMLQALAAMLHAPGPIFAAYLTGRAAARLLDVVDTLEPLERFLNTSP